MKILREYILDNIRQNKRSSIAIMIALFLMTSMMSCFCGMVYTMWTDSVGREKWHNGNWHGELFDDTYGKDLPKIENYASVEAALVKGPWEVAKLEDQGRRNYLITRGANKEYWDSMTEKYYITKGRIPKRENELALSKQYFEKHPKAKIGDTLTLPIGNRMYQGEPCDPTENFHEQEEFQQTGTKTYTIVGELDVTTSSSVPAYTGMTYLDLENLQPQDSITVYLRFDPMRNTYRELPALAESIGYEKDEYGNYSLKYNSSLLSVCGVFPPGSFEGINLLNLFTVPLMFAAFAILLIGVFVLVIHNAFAVSVTEKLSQVGTLAGIGASPKQIKKMMISEALFLSLFPMLPGIAAGWFLNRQLFALINATNDVGRDGPDIIATFGFPAAIPAVLLTFITVWLSARIPAAKAAKLLPVEIQRQEGNKQIQKMKQHNRKYHTGILRELAGNAVYFRRKAYRTATISLCLSFLFLTSFQYLISIQDARKQVFADEKAQSNDIDVTISDGRWPDRAAIEGLKNVSNLSAPLLVNKLSCALWVEPEEASEEMMTHLGGFAGIVEQGKYSLVEKNGQYRIQTLLFGLDRDSFETYCQKLGIDAKSYYQDTSKLLIYNKMRDPQASTRRNTVQREFLKLEKGQKLTFTEKNQDDVVGDFQFELQVGDFVDFLPEELGSSSTYSNFTLIAMMPMEHVSALGASCCEKKQNSVKNLRVSYNLEEGASLTDIEEASEEVEHVVNQYYGSGDYSVASLADREKMAADTRYAMTLIFTFLTGFLAVVGLSNIWATISGNLRQRRREFAMLKSVGLTPKQLWRMLCLEVITLGLKPLLYTIPFQILWIGFFLHSSELRLLEYLPYFPIDVIGGYTCLVILAILGAYILGGRRLLKESIMEAIKDDTI